MCRVQEDIQIISEALNFYFCAAIVTIIFSFTNAAGGRNKKMQFDGNVKKPVICIIYSNDTKKTNRALDASIEGLCSLFKVCRDDSTS